MSRTSRPTLTRRSRRRRSNHSWLTGSRANPGAARPVARPVRQPAQWPSRALDWCRLASAAQLSAQGILASSRVTTVCRNLVCIHNSCHPYGRKWNFRFPEAALPVAGLGRAGCLRPDTSLRLAVQALQPDAQVPPQMFRECPLRLTSFPQLLDDTAERLAHVSRAGRTAHASPEHRPGAFTALLTASLRFRLKTLDSGLKTRTVSPIYQNTNPAPQTFLACDEITRDLTPREFLQCYYELQRMFGKIFG